MMTPRHITIGGRPTSADGWTLCEWKLSAPSYRRSTLTLPGTDGDLDLSDTLTGRVIYNSRTFTARLELSEGTRRSRDALISKYLNTFDGTEQQIMLPDDRSHFITGRLSISVQYSDHAHACINVSAACDPWRYCVDRCVFLLDSPNGTDDPDAEPVFTSAVIVNGGRAPVQPMFRADGGDVILSAGSYRFTVADGSQRTIPDIMFYPGSNTLLHCGDRAAARLRVTFREAIL